jgi:hypothetical protein
MAGKRTRKRPLTLRQVIYKKLADGLYGRTDFWDGITGCNVCGGLAALRTSMRFIFIFLATANEEEKTLRLDSSKRKLGLRALKTRRKR